MTNVNLSDIQGKLIFIKTETNLSANNNVISINELNLAKGIYILQMSSTNTFSNLRFIIK